MKKKIKILIIPILIIAIVIGIEFAWYLFTTMSNKGCVNYCCEKTRREATEFVSRGDGRYEKDYVYWIAANGDSSKSQEIFIFKKKYMWPFHLDRYQYVTSSTQSSSLDGGSEVGSIQFFTRNDKGEKESGATLLFYGAASESNIVRYEYTLTVREGSNVYKGNIGPKDSVWLVKFFDLGNTDHNRKKVITEVKFFDADDNLVCVY